MNTVTPAVADLVREKLKLEAAGRELRRLMQKR
jgi:hypothetical protein